MLSNAYFLAKFRFDTAENEPAKNLQILQNFAKQAACPPPQQALRRRLEKGCLRICVKMLGFLFGKYRVRGIHWLKLRDRYFVVEQSRNHGADYGGGSGDRHTHG